MPKKFLKCVKEGGRVRTIVPKKCKYLKICYDKKSKSHIGEVKTKKGCKSSKKKIYKGSRGGKYYLTKGGNKVYVK
jgi:hypothetical protein